MACQKPSATPPSGGGPVATQPMPAPTGAGKDAIDALVAGHLRQLTSAARTALESNDGDARVQIAMALGLYHDAVHALTRDMMESLERQQGESGFDHVRGRGALVAAEADLGRVERHLAEAAKDPRVALELCLACWEVDWNGTGGITTADRLLFQIEVDGDGEPIPEDDPRRKPTFRFDHGDVLWARAMVAFQRAILDIVLAYDWHELDRFIDGTPDSLTLRLKDRKRIDEARARIVDALEYSDRSRVAYLAETDDDREWLPSPAQRDHPMPLPVDAALYSTWEHSIDDLQALVAGREGISVAEIAQLGDHKWESPPGGFVDVGKLLSDPGDITISLAGLSSVDLERKADVERVLSDVLGKSYVRKMAASPLIARLHRMKTEVDTGDDTFERKLRYMLWIN